MVWLMKDGCGDSTCFPLKYLYHNWLNYSNLLIIRALAITVFILTIIDVFEMVAILFSFNFVRIVILFYGTYFIQDKLLFISALTRPNDPMETTVPKWCCGLTHHLSAPLFDVFILKWV